MDKRSFVRYQIPEGEESTIRILPCDPPHVWAKEHASWATPGCLICEAMEKSISPSVTKKNMYIIAAMVNGQQNWLQISEKMYNKIKEVAIRKSWWQRFKMWFKNLIGA